MVELNTKHVIKFQDREANQEVNFSVEDGEDIDDAYNKIRDQICSEKNITIQEFESRYACTGRKEFISFSDKPWDSSSELVELLTNIDGVNSVRYISPTMENYGPPRYSIDTNLSFDEISERVNSVYYGLIVVDNKFGIEVICSPIKYRNQIK